MIFFSNLNSASVLNPSLVHVFLTATGSKLAISTKIFFVVSVIQLSSPPTTPASASIFFLSVITISVDFNVCSVSNRSLNFSPSLAFLTIISPSTFSASKKWIGCPLIFIKRLEKSTQLLIGLLQRSNVCNLEKNDADCTFTFLRCNNKYAFKPSLSPTTFLSGFVLFSNICMICSGVHCSWYFFTLLNVIAHFSFP